MIIFESMQVHQSAIVEPGAQVGEGTRVWHFCHIMAGGKVGSDCILGQNVFIDNNAVVGNRVKIQNNVSVYNNVILEDDVFIGPSAVFTNVINPRSFIERKDQFKKTVVKKGATVGANSTIICGISIGEYALIGAGAVVTSSVPAYALALGNPVRLAGWVSKAGIKLQFDKDGFAECRQTGERYVLTKGAVTII